jgi:hypothetical protein
MKTNYNVLKTFAIALLFSTVSWSQATIAQWNFNGPDNTSVPGGAASPSVSVGAGSAQLVALTLPATFASGNSTVGTLETETTSPPNFGWNSTGYPATGTGDKTAGVQFNVSTVGQAGIIFGFEQRLSNTANNTYIVQYTADRTAASPVWVDGPVFTFVPAATGTGDTWYNSRIANFETVTALDNNPNVAFRVLSTFDPGTGNYLAARSTSTYAGGTVRYDMVGIYSNVTLATSQFESKKQFTISPNPTNKGIVTLSQPQDIKVYDLTGKLILDAKNAETINTQSFNAGVYMVQAKSGETTKLVVK